MTALIAILNKNAVALAADSAVTSRKIHNSANKLFTLSKFEPVAVMVYGMSEFMRLPWETVIKMYRSQLGETQFQHLEDYASDFLRYLSSEALIVPATRQAAVLVDTMRAVLYEIRESILTEVRKRVGGALPLAEEQVPDLVAEVVTTHKDAFLQYPRLAGFDEEFEDNFIRLHAEEIRDLARTVFEDLPINHVLEDIKLVCCYRFTRDYWSTHSGLVFAGFGRQNVLPVVKAYRVECVFSGRLRHRFDDQLSSDLNSDEGNAVIIPYAQFDVVHRFLKGIDGTYRKQYSTHLRTLLCETYPERLIAEAAIEDEDELRTKKAELIHFGRNAVEEFNGAWEKFEQSTFVQPVIDVIAELPIQELASIAESLLSLTSLQRKITNTAETVGGPVDVAVISKGDGFVWIKRKHYFDKELNVGFFGNYFRPSGGGDE